MHFRQSIRLAHLISYCVILFIINRLVTGVWGIPSDYKGFWFYSGAFIVTLGSLLVTPYFTSPANGLSYAFALLISVLTVTHPTNLDQISLQLFGGLEFLCGAVIFLGVGSIAMKDSQSSKRQEVSERFRIAVQVLANPKFLYSLVIIISAYAYYRESGTNVLLLCCAAFVVITKPVELIHDAISKIFMRRFSTLSTDVIGTIDSFQEPKIISIAVDYPDIIQFGQFAVSNSASTGGDLYLTINYAGRDGKKLLRALLLGKLVDFHLNPRSFHINSEEVHLLRQPPQNLQNIAESRLLGVVSSESTVQELRIEIVREVSLVVGSLIETAVGARNNVLYQIVNGVTKEEVVRAHNTYGYITALAAPIGVWLKESNAFESVNWIPSPNAVVFGHQGPQSPPVVSERSTTMGYFPNTEIPIEIGDIDGLVTHNTAILGTLGMGKSSLCLNLVELLIERGIKVLCVDVTDEYEKELHKDVNLSFQQEIIDAVQEKGKAGKSKVKKNVAEGGSVNDVKEIFSEKVAQFMKSADKVLCINPNNFEIWRQDSKPYQETASMVQLTVTQITHILSEVCLEICQGEGMSKSARLCLVYEEAHFLIPEYTALVDEGDKAASNGTARAILQGRKFGMGCILVSQRTANVTKTILNQCNTIFTFKIVDDTGINYLKNVIGSLYAYLTPSLSQWQAILFGRASKSNTPVLFQTRKRKELPGPQNPESSILTQPDSSHG